MNQTCTECKSFFPPIKVHEPYCFLCCPTVTTLDHGRWMFTELESSYIIVETKKLNTNLHYRFIRIPKEEFIFFSKQYQSFLSNWYTISTLHEDIYERRHFVLKSYLVQLQKQKLQLVLSLF